MAKKNLVMKYAGYFALLMAIVSLCMIFCTAIVYTVPNADPVSYSGLNVVFGFKEPQASIGNSKYETEWFKFSFMNLLTYILLIVGIVFSVLRLAGKKSKLFTIITAACFIVAGVFMFLTIPYSIVGAGQLTGELLLDKQYMSLGAGAIIGGVFACAAGAYKVGEFLLG